ncbi:MAG: hypothetical protein C3F02_03015 [Parcubacteria group bacterium]|nr:MAG: hypothetical protein C3F02_03015 [Parcubacteria group bacterium]
MSKIKFNYSYDYIISLENLLLAWQEFIKGKRSRRDVQEFELDLMSNIIALHSDLKNKTYWHSDYQAFNISDPKPRNIHKASVRDRLLHHAIYRVLYPFFDTTFIADSYSCRLGKGTHKAINKFCNFAYRASQNHTKTAWVLKGDIKKFFANIDHSILIDILSQYIADENILWLLNRVIDSFHINNKGLPLGNLTSQLLVNVYMNTFDQFVKHKLKAKYYIRYADDFVILSKDKKWLENILGVIKHFLNNDLRLQLHPDKVFIKTLYSGIDFLGWVHFTDHRVLRTTSKKRMLTRLKLKNYNEFTKQSYLGLFGYGNTMKLKGLLDFPL